MGLLFGGALVVGGLKKKHGESQQFECPPEKRLDGSTRVEREHEATPKKHFKCLWYAGSGADS